jgi:hypothetical protein
VPGGVRASLEDGRVVIRFAHRKAQCMQVARADIASADFGGEEPAECPEGEAPVVATSEGETIDAPSVLGFHSQKPQLIERMFEPAQGKRVGGETSPGVAALAHERFLLTWVDENPHGHRLHAQVVEKWGAAVGGQLDLSPADASVIGRASAVVGAEGRGLVAYLASNGHGFDVLEKTVVCGAHGDARR